MSGERVRVVVVDDQLPFRRAVRSVLEVMDEFELVGEATSGEEAVQVTGLLGPDLVLMDVHMEGMGGVEAALRIRTAEPETSVILVSSYRTDDLAADGAAAGAVACLPKDRFGAATLRELWSSRQKPRAPRDTEGRPSRDG
jgi:two-component system, NarL family, invasion response regulator UvrY